MSTDNYANVTPPLEPILQRVCQAADITTDTEIATVLKVGRSSVPTWRNRNTIPYEDLIKFASAKGLNLYWLLYGRGPMLLEEAEGRVLRGDDGEHLSSEDIAYSLSRKALNEEVRERGEKYNAHLSVAEAVLLVRTGVYVWVPYYNLPLSAGGGAEVLSQEPKQWNFYTRSYLESRGLHAADLAEFPVWGNSMRGAIDHGSTALLDRSKNEVFSKDIYAASVGKDLIVKFMEPAGEDILVTSTDAQAYPPMTIRKADLESGYARIIGRVQSHRVDR